MEEKLVLYLVLLCVVLLWVPRVFGKVISVAEVSLVERYCLVVLRGRQERQRTSAI